MRDCNGTPIEQGQQVEELVTGYEYDVQFVGVEGMRVKMTDDESVYSTFVPGCDGSLFSVSSKEMEV